MKRVTFLGGDDGFHSVTDFFSRIYFAQPYVSSICRQSSQYRLIEITLLITGIAAVTFFNEMYVFAGVVFMLFCCSGLMEWRHRREEKQYVYDSFYAGLSAALGVLIFFIS